MGIAPPEIPQPAPVPLTDGEQSIVDDVSAAIRQGECILFLGAGVHATPQARHNLEDILARVPAERFETASRAAMAALPPEVVQLATDAGVADAATREEAQLSLLKATLEQVLAPIYPPASRPLLGGDLAQHLADQVQFGKAFPNDSARNLGRVGLYFELLGQGKSRNALVNEVKDAVYTNKKPSPIVRALARLPFTVIITTNYDNLLERALRAEDREPMVNVYDKKGRRNMQDWSRRVTVQTPYVLKLHGDVGMAETMVVTDEDYIQFVLRMTDKPPGNPVPEGLRGQLKDNSILFIGYSLMDYNLRLLFKTIRWSMDVADIKPSYSVDPRPNELVVRVLSSSEEQVKFIAQDAWTVVPRLYEAVMNKPFDLLGADR